MLAGQVTNKPRTLDQLLGREFAARLDRIDVVSAKMFAGKLPGERRSKRRGRSVEFDDYREYIPGDDLRHVDWNVMARLDRLFIKLFREDEDLSVHMFVDLSPSMDAGDPSKQVFAARLAMAFGYIALANQNRLIASVYSGPGRPGAMAAQRGGLQMLAPMRGRSGARRLGALLLDAMQPTPAGGAEDARRGAHAAMDFNAALRTVARTRAGRGVVMIISDFLVPEGFESGLNALFGDPTASFDTWCFQVLSPVELDPRKDATATLTGDVALTDVETGRRVDVTMAPEIIDRYRRMLDEHNARLRRACASRGMRYMRISSDAAVEPLVLSTLRRSGLFR